MKVYQREKYNPMSGCLPMLIQMPILFGMIDVIYRPLTHLMHLPQETITLAQNILSRMDTGGDLFQL
jgi:YidC/Oxa1 family membrane protein insertase